MEKVIKEKLTREDIEYVLDNLGDMTESERYQIVNALSEPLTLDTLVKGYDLLLKVMRFEQASKR